MRHMVSYRVREQMAILMMSGRGELTASGLSDEFEVDRPRTTKILRDLYRAGKLEKNHRGSEIFYSIRKGQEKIVTEARELLCEYLADDLRHYFSVIPETIREDFLTRSKTLAEKLLESRKKETQTKYHILKIEPYHHIAQILLSDAASVPENSWFRFTNRQIARSYSSRYPEEARNAKSYRGRPLVSTDGLFSSNMSGYVVKIILSEIESAVPNFEKYFNKVHARRGRSKYNLQMVPEIKKALEKIKAELD